MSNVVESIALRKLVEHPDNPNKQSAATFAKLVRNIERTGRYEPIVVRPHPKRKGYYQIINGHHRVRALAKLGRQQADCVVWDVDDAEADVLLATLNRLCGCDGVDKKLALLKRLSGRFELKELSRLVPQGRAELERLARLAATRKVKASPVPGFAEPMVFFLDKAQQQVVEKALAAAEQVVQGANKAERRASGLAVIASCYLERQDNRRRQR